VPSYYKLLPFAESS